MRSLCGKIVVLSFLTVAVSCGKNPAGDSPAGGRYYSFSATFFPADKASVTPSGVVSWSSGDKISVYTTSGAVRTFDMLSLKDGVATFGARLAAGETPSTLAVYPQGTLSGVSGGAATIRYPSSYTWSDGEMKAPMYAAVREGSLYFKHLGCLVYLRCENAPATAASLVLTAEGQKICGTFPVPVTEGMSVNTTASQDENSVSVKALPEGGGAMDIIIPIPAGAYSSIYAEFRDSAGRPVVGWTVEEEITLSPADMLLRGMSSLPEIAGTAIHPESTRVGRITDSVSGEGIPGVPVTDGYTITTTDSHGVYQFVAHADARCVYPSIPAAYEVPLGSDGEPQFWKTGSYRNDWALTPRAESWEDFSIVAFSDVHFWNRGASQNEEVTMFNERTRPDINAYIATLSDKVILFNTGDVVTNVPLKLPQARAEFAKIKKNGVTVPMFPTIGNHDFNNGYTNTLACSSDWFDVFGPLDYSFNLGKVHVVCMNNIQYAGNSSGGYGKAMQYTKGLTDAQWAWLQADLATVADKSETMLILCVHAPVTNHDDAHAEDIRGILKSFAESHIISGHSHYNVHRQYADGKNSVYTGRLAEEHNLNPLGGLWRSSLGNDGSPNSFHVFNVTGKTMGSQIFKAIGSADASYQMRLYDGSASYHTPVTDTYNGNEDIAGSGKLYFDWNTIWQSSEGIGTSGKLIARVFDAGSRNIGVNVYCTVNGVRTPMTPCSVTHRDQCTYSFFINSGSLNGTMTANWAQAYYQVKTSGYWYCDMPSGSGWKVEVEFVEPSGSRWYECSSIQTDYTGFAW